MPNGDMTLAKEAAAKPGFKSVSTRDYSVPAYLWMVPSEATAYTAPP